MNTVYAAIKGGLKQRRFVANGIHIHDRAVDLGGKVVEEEAVDFIQKSLPQLFETEQDPVPKKASFTAVSGNTTEKQAEEARETLPNSEVLMQHFTTALEEMKHMA